MTQATLHAITATYQQQITQHDHALHATLATAHEQAVMQIQPHLDYLYRQIELKRQAGEEVNIAWLYRGERMRLLKQVIAHHINHFASLAHMMSLEAQRQGVTLGWHSGLAQVKGVAHGQLVNLPTDHALHAIAEYHDGSRAQLFQGYGAEAAQEVARSLISGMALKQPVKHLASNVLGKLKHSLNRAIVTVGEAFMGAYRWVVSLFYRENSDLIEQWQWTAEAGCCPICADLNGSIHSIDEDFEPPHPRCRCEASPIQVSASEVTP